MVRIFALKKEIFPNQTFLPLTSRPNRCHGKQRSALSALVNLGGPVCHHQTDECGLLARHKALDCVPGIFGPSSEDVFPFPKTKHQPFVKSDITLAQLSELRKY